MHTSVTEFVDLFWYLSSAWSCYLLPIHSELMVLATWSHSLCYTLRIVYNNTDIATVLYMRYMEGLIGFTLNLVNSLYNW